MRDVIPLVIRHVPTWSSARLRVAFLVVASAVAAVAARAAAQEQIDTSGPIELGWKVRYDQTTSASDAFSSIVLGNGVTYAAGYSAGLVGSDRLLVSARAVSGGALVWEVAPSLETVVTDPLRVGLALSPDGSVLYCAHIAGGVGPTEGLFVGAVTRFDTGTGQVLSTWRCSNGDTGFQTLALSADGTRLYANGGLELLSSCLEGTVAFDTSTGAELWEALDFHAPFGSVTHAVVIVSGGQRILEGRDHSLRELDAANGSVLWTAATGSAAVDYDPLSQRVFTADDDQVLALDVVTGAPVASFVNPSSLGARDVVADAHGRVFVLADSLLGPQVAAFDTQLGFLWSNAGSALGPSNASCLVVSSDGSVYRSASASNGATPSVEVRRLLAASGAQVWNATAVASGALPELPLVVDAASQRVCIAGGHATAAPGMDALRVDLDLQTGALLAEHDSQVVGSAYQDVQEAQLAPGGGELIVAGLLQDENAVLAALSSSDGGVRWIATAPHARFDEHGYNPSPARRMTIDGTRVCALLAEKAATGGYQQMRVVALDRATGAVQWSATYPPTQLDSADLALVDGGAVLVTSGRDSSGALVLRGFDAASGASLWLVHGLSSSNLYVVRPRLAAVPGGADFVVSYSTLSMSTSGVVERRSSANGALAWRTLLPPAPSEVSVSLVGNAVEPSGARVYASTYVTKFQVPSPSRVFALDAASGAVAWQNDGPVVGLPSCLALALDGKRIAVASRNDSVSPWRARVIDAAQGHTVWDHELGPAQGPAHRGLVQALTFDPSGAKLYAGGAFGPDLHPDLPTALAAAAYDANDGAELWSFAYSTAPTWFGRCAGIAIDPSGTRLYEAGGTFDPITGTDLVALALELPALVAHPASISLAAGGTQTFDLAPGAAHAFDYAWLIGSASGTAPGFAVGGLLVPLNPDAYLQFTLANPNSGVLPDSLGLLNAAGQRTSHFVIRAASDPALAGIVGHHAFAVIDATTFVPELVSNAVAVTLVP